MKVAAWSQSTEKASLIPQTPPSVSLWSTVLQKHNATLR